MSITAIDIECYPNYFLLVGRKAAGRTVCYDQTRGGSLDRKGVAGLLSKYMTIGFNSLNYDLPLLAFALQHIHSCGELWAFSNEIIRSNKPGWMTMRDHGLAWDFPIDHIDLIQVAPGVKISLKLYAARIGSSWLKDLPYDPAKPLTPSQRTEVKRYCVNDCRVTCELYEAVRDRIELRERLSQKYRMDLRSKSDAQIAEAIIKSHLVAVSRPEAMIEGEVVRYCPPDWIDFKPGGSCEGIMLEMIDKDFTIGKNGQFAKSLCRLPSVKIGAMRYQVGIGGLHSTEKRRVLRADANTRIVDADVASYYPSLILHLGIYPKHLGKAFLNVYRDIVVQRLEAKANGDKATANGLKITTNGTFGKLSSPYSFLYSPENMLKVTLTGQLALLMLIERLHCSGIEVVSANTDGVSVVVRSEKEREFANVIEEWQKDTGMTLEQTEYSILVSRDVNNYFAVKIDGTVKTKGFFESYGLMKNPDGNIISKSVIEFMKCGTPLRETITTETGIREFLFARRSTKSEITHDGESIGRVGRWYYSTNGSQLNNAIGKVAKSEGGMALQKIDDESIPSDIDYDHYCAVASEVLADLGLADL